MTSEPGVAYTVISGEDNNDIYAGGFVKQNGASTRVAMIQRFTDSTNLVH